MLHDIKTVLIPLLFDPTLPSGGINGVAMMVWLVVLLIIGNAVCEYVRKK